MPDSDWCTSVATLKSTRWRTGSQSSCPTEHRPYVVGVAASGTSNQTGGGVLNRLQPVHSPSEMPKNSELQ